MTSGSIFGSLVGVEHSVELGVAACRCFLSGRWSCHCFSLFGSGGPGRPGDCDSVLHDCIGFFLRDGKSVKPRAHGPVNAERNPEVYRRASAKQ